MSTRFCFCVVLIVIFLVYFTFAFLPIETLLKYFILDDAFYYFKTASNIASGLGPTFDGENLTNGYHPLWMAINVVVYYLIPDDKILPISLIMFFSVLLFFATTVVVWKIISRFTQSKAIQHVFTLAFALNPWNISMNLGGLETSLALFFVACSILILLKIFDDEENALNFLHLGIVSGLMILSRLDYALFPFVIGIYFLFKKRHFFWKRVIFFTLPVVVLAGPWFLYNYIYFGSPIPASGLSYTLINHRLFFYKDRSVITIILWSLHNIIGTIVSTLNYIGIPIYYSAKDFTKSLFWIIGVAIAVLALLMYFYKTKREQFLAFIQGLLASRQFLALFLFFIPYILFVIIHGGIRWSGRSWYFATFSMNVVLFIALIVSKKPLFDFRKIIIGVFAIYSVATYSYYFILMYPQHENQVEVYRAALWVRDNTPQDARIASFNSGIHGYFTDRFIMNSDGLINNAAFEAMRQNRLWNLFKENNIKYILDYEIVLTYRYKSFFGIVDPLEKVKKIDLPSSIYGRRGYGGTHVNFYEIVKY